MKKINIIFCLALTVFIYACDNPSSTTQYTPIVLGDSSTIVTETDTNYLSNVIDDIDQVTPANVVAKVDSPSVTKARETVTKIDTVVKENKQENKSVAGLNTNGVAILVGNETYIVVEGVNTTSSKQIDGQKQSEIVLALKNSKYNSAEVKVHNGKLNKAEYRYSSIPYVSVSNKTVGLTSLGSFRSSWKNISSKGGSVAAPTIKQIDYKSVSGNQLKTAVSSALQSRNYKPKAIDAITKKIGKNAKVTQAPFSLSINGFDMKIVGTDAKGKSFEKIIKLTF